MLYVLDRVIGETDSPTRNPTRNLLLAESPEHDGSTVLLASAYRPLSTGAHNLQAD